MMNAEASSGGLRLLAIATVGDLPLRPHVRVEVTTPLARVVEDLHARGRGCVLVEDDGALVGVFTERDVVTRVSLGDPRWGDTVVGEVMTRHPTAIQPTDSLAEALRRLTSGRRRHLPVVDDHRHAVGLLSVRDILSYIASRFPEEMVNLPPDPDHET